MKNIVKILVVAILAVSFQSHAQTFGVKAGFNMSDMTMEYDGFSTEADMKPGFHVGGTMDYSFTDLLSLETSLLFITKGAKNTTEVSFMGVDAKVTSVIANYYIDIPITLKATHEIAGVDVFVAAGPYIGVGLFGKIETTVESMGEKTTEDEDVKWGSNEEEDNLKRLDWGLSFGAGVEVDAIQIGVFYDLGLANISPQKEGTSKNSNLKLSIGYRFGE